MKGTLIHRCLYPWQTLLLLLAALLQINLALAAPGDILFSDDFERNSLGGNWSTSNNAYSGIGTHTANSGNRSLYTRWDAVDVTSRAIDLSTTPGVQLSMWIRIGDDIGGNTFSEWPDSAGEDLVIQYLNNNSDWITLETFIGGDHTDGAIYNRTYTLPASALHANFRIRIRQTGGSGNDYDYYHIDDVTLTETAAAPTLSYNMCEDFESGLNYWEINAIEGTAGIGTHTYSSADHSLYLRGGEVAVNSLAIDTSAVSTPLLGLWLRRGSDAFSEDPDSGEDLRVEYFNSSGTWVTLESFSGSGTAGEIITRNYTLPADAAHANFKIRLYQEDGDTGDSDYWHVDDVCFGQPSEKDLIAYYTLDETSWNSNSDEVLDASGNNLHGTAQNGVSTTTAKVCRGGYFNGSNGPVNISDNALLDLSDELTASAWIRPYAIPGSGIMTILSKDENYEFHVNSSGEIYWWWHDSTNQQRSLTTSGANIQAGDWYHVAVTYRSGSQTIYVNGSPLATASYNGTLRTNNDPLQIGGDQGYSGRQFNGLIDEVRIYGVAQNASEVLADMYATHPCPPSTLQGCEAIFPSAVQNSDSGGQIRLDWDGTVSDPDNALETMNLDDNNDWNSTDSCITSDCVATNTLSQLPVIDSFESSTGNHNVNTGWQGSFALGSDGRSDYRNITTGQDSVISDSGAFTTYHIDRLTLRWSDEWILRGGTDYWIEDLRFNGSDVTIRVVGSGTARVFIRDAVDFDSWNMDMNSSGSPGQLLFVVDDDITIDTGSTNNAIFYATGNVNVAYNSRVYGAIAAEDRIRLRGTINAKIGQVIYDSASIADLDHRGFCGAVSSGLHHIEIRHDGSALTCQPDSVTLRACANADCSSLYTGTVTATLTPTGWVGGDTVTFSGGQTTVELRHNSPGSVTLGISSAVPNPTSSTKCFLSGVEGSCTMLFHDSGFLFDVPAQTSCAVSAPVTISAVRMDATTERCVPAFSSRTETINFWSTYANPASGTHSLRINGTPIAGSSPGTGIPLSFDANGQSSFTVEYSDAGQLQLDAYFSGSGDEAGLVMSGNDSFVTAPAKFYVYSSDGGADCASGSANCSVFKKAGEDFNLTVRAACSDNSVTPNFTHTGVSLAPNLIAPAGGVPGSLGVNSVTFAASDNGEVTIPDQKISEVGVFTITASVGDYLGVTSGSGNLIEGTSANIGRFIPARLSIGSNTPELADACTGGATDFTYLGQNSVGGNSGGLGFSTDPVITVTPQDLDGNFTRNYAGDFWKLDTALSNRTYANQAATAAVLSQDADGGAATLAGADFDATPPTLTISGDRLSYSRPADPEDPFSANVRLTLSADDLTDSDGVCYDSASARCNTTNGDTPSSYTISGIGGALMRYGRGSTRDVYGTNGEVGSQLVVPLTALFHDSSNGGWTANKDDSCTIVSYTQVDTDITTNSSPASPITLSSGGGDITATVTADPGDVGGSTTYNFTWPAWLPDADQATATFGIFRGDDSYLYWNEQ